MIFNLIRGKSSPLELKSLNASGEFTNPQIVYEAPDLTGLTFTVDYELDKSAMTDVSPETYNTIGNQNVTFRFTDNNVTVTATKAVNVIGTPISLSVNGDWSNVQLKDNVPDITGLIFTVTYLNGETQSITPTAIYPSFWGETGTQTATFSYTENGVTVTATKDATVLKKVLGIVISGEWSNTQYTGMPVDYTGLIFTAQYNDGTTAVVTPTSYTPTVWSGSSSTVRPCMFSYTESGITVYETTFVNVKYLGPILNNNDWDTIKMIADAGIASQYWSVGDYKNVSVAAGTVDQMSVNAGTYRAVIISINHNPTYENPNSIDFAIGQNTSGTDICFYNSTGVRMNTSNITTGGWTGSQMYLTYLPQFYNLLSGNTGLQSAMIAPKKYTHNATGGSANNTAANVTLSENPNYKMFLMAEYEIFGSRIGANSYEKDKQAQYAYYSSSGLAKSKVRYRTDTVAASIWWERSAYCSGSSTGSFLSVDTSGNADRSYSNYARGLCPCFRV